MSMRHGEKVSPPRVMSNIIKQVCSILVRTLHLPKLIWHGYTYSTVEPNEHALGQGQYWLDLAGLNDLFVNDLSLLTMLLIAYRKICSLQPNLRYTSPVLPNLMFLYSNISFDGAQNEIRW